ncbi:MAG TPA: adenylate/guanylate cyclase domain-containing protein [Sumerlaeia bacterium]|nr:adenylate/guanylate cyclase domain-containing protein [Sumerlaeia bacterium]
MLAKLRKRRGRYLRSLATGLAFLVIANGVGWLYFEGFENRVVDWFVYWKCEPEERDPGVVIVEVDEAAFDSQGRVQPFNRAYLGNLVERISLFGPAAILLDFRLEDPAAEPEQDTRLVEALASAASRTRVVLARTLKIPEDAGEEDGRDAPAYVVRELLPEMENLIEREANIHQGLTNVPRGRDYVVRNFTPLWRASSGELLMTFSFAAAFHLCNGDVEQLRAESRARSVSFSPGESSLPQFAGKDAIRFRAGRECRIDFRGAAGEAFRAIPAGLVAGLPKPESAGSDNLFRDQFVFIGGTFSESGDFHATPKGRMPGVEVHANILHTILNRPSSRVRNVVFGLVLQLVFFPIISAFYTAYRPGRATLLALLAVVFVMIPASALCFASMGCALDFTPNLAPPILAIGLHGAYGDRRARRRIRDSFASHVSPAVVAALYDGEEDVLKGGWRQATILFCDIRGFTRLSFTIPPETMVAFLNDFYAEMTRICFAHRGTVNKYIGDCLLVVFNAPLDDPDHVDHAIAAGVEMMRAVRQLQEKWRRRDANLRFDMGVGIHTGQAFCGVIGSRQKQEYGVIGKDVIVAFEIEQFNKRRGTHILVSTATYERSSKTHAASDEPRAETLKSGETVEVVEIKAD